MGGRGGRKEELYIHRQGKVKEKGYVHVLEDGQRQRQRESGKGAETRTRKKMMK